MWPVVTEQADTTVDSPYGLAFAAPAMGWHRAIRSGLGLPTHTLTISVTVVVSEQLRTRPRTPWWTSHKPTKRRPTATITTSGNTPAMTMSWRNVMRSAVVNECWIDGSASENSRLNPEITELVMPANKPTSTIVTTQSKTPTHTHSSPLGQHQSNHLPFNPLSTSSRAHD